MRFTTIRGLAFGLALLCGAVAAHAQSAKENQTTQVGDVGKQLVAYAARAESLGFTGVFLAAKDGAVVAAAGVGFADLENKVPITPATLFEIASSSKQITAAAVVRLMQDKRLGLDDSIAKHLPGIPENCREITVRHLVQHTSGIPGTNSAGGGEDLAAVLPTFLAGGPQHPPGTHWEYWNQGYALLTEIVARAAKKPFVDYCREALFGPAGMKWTGFNGDPAPKGATVVIGRSEQGARSALEHPYGAFGFQYRGMGGVVTTVWDLWRWDRALKGDKLLGKKAKEELFRPGLEDYALGWFVRKNSAGRLVQSHSGSVRGFICELRRFPDQDGCLFVLGNSDDAPSVQVADGLEAILFGDPGAGAPPPGPLPDDLQKAVTGTWQDARGNRFEIVAEGRTTRGRILWSAGQVSRGILGQSADGSVVFFDWSSTTPMTVDRDGKGPAKGLRIVDQAFTRVE